MNLPQRIVIILGALAMILNCIHGPTKKVSAGKNYFGIPESRTVPDNGRLLVNTFAIVVVTGGLVLVVGKKRE